MELDPAQSRAARGLIEWSQTQLANAAGISLSTVRDFEKRRRNPLPENLTSIRRALEKVGVIFLDPHGEEGPGVRLKKRPVRKK